MSDRRCPGALEIEAARDGRGENPAAVSEHAAACSSCQKVWDELEAVARITRELPTDEVSSAEARELADRFLLALDHPREQAPRRRWTWMLAAAAVVVVVAGTAVAYFRRGPTPGPREAGAVVADGGGAPRIRSQVFAAPDTDYRELSSSQGVMIRLREGTVICDVEHLPPGHRYRVAVGDAEIEVRGTVFEVSAADDRLRLVKVIRGTVEVRPAGRPAVRIVAGEAYRPAAVAEAPASPREATPSPGAAPTRPFDAGVAGVASAAPAGESAAPPPAAPHHSPRRAEATPFREAMERMVRGEFAAAAELFAAEGRRPGSRFREDALFWEGVVRARAGQVRGAIEVLDRFLKAHPRSVRVGEARIIMAGQLRRHGRVAQAIEQLRAASADPSPDTRRRAQAGLRELSATPPPR
jgi:TolA-binding protein